VFGVDHGDNHGDIWVTSGGLASFGDKVLMLGVWSSGRMPREIRL
jgi:hypothetical protein